MTGKEIRISMFTAGQIVTYQGRNCMVEFNMLSQGKLLVKLSDIYHIVNSEDIICRPTLFTYNEKKI